MTWIALGVAIDDGLQIAFDSYTCTLEGCSHWTSPHITSMKVNLVIAKKNLEVFCLCFLVDDAWSLSALKFKRLYVRATITAMT